MRSLKHHPMISVESYLVRRYCLHIVLKKINGVSDHYLFIHALSFLNKIRHKNASSWLSTIQCNLLSEIVRSKSVMICRQHFPHHIPPTFVVLTPMVNEGRIHSDSGSSPVRRQSIIWTSVSLLFINAIENKFEWTLNKITRMFREENNLSSARMGDFVSASICWHIVA